MSISAPELASRIGVPYETLDNWRRAGIVAPAGQGPGVRAPLDDHEAAWVELVARTAQIMGRGGGRGSRELKRWSNGWWVLMRELRERPVTGPVLAITAHGATYIQPAEAWGLLQRETAAVFVPVPTDLLEEQDW